VRTWVTQKVIDTRDVTKRESVFISQLRSQPTISWVAFGGSFFAGHKLGDSGIETMEIAAPDRKLRLKQFEYVGTELEPRGSRVEDTIIIGPETRRLAGDRIVVRELDRLAVYGRAGGLQIYELLGMASEFEGALNWVASYEAGLAAWRAGDFAAAIGAFENVLQTRKTDAASSLMIERCKHQHDNPAGDGWDGTSVALTK